ncbi:MAG: signal peptidase I [Elusimicrobiota bacterium]|nr:signal peptidase I [Elusimicrobiota bacterium]
MAQILYYLSTGITIAAVLFIFFKLPEMQTELKMIIVAGILGVEALLLRLIAREAKEKFLKKVNGAREWVNTGLVAVVLAWVIMSFIIQAFKIPSGSMMNTFKIGDHIFVAKFIYGVHIPFSKKYIFPLQEPKRGEIIVFQFPLDPKKDFIKRCIGVPGDTIEIRDKRLYVNGEIQEEEYAIYADEKVYPNSRQLPVMYRNRDNLASVVVPENFYFVMGDNRDHSYDSRFWGPLDRGSIKGKALFLYWPPKRIRIIK